MQIWEEILDIRNPLPDDNFFLCGGNSLTAIELLIKIQRYFCVNFPPDTIYRYPTIRDQACLISRNSGTSDLYHPLIVPIRKNGKKSPLFCFHEIGGWIGQYQTISPFLDQDRPMFGIRARGLEPGEKPKPTVEEAVMEYYDAIKTVQKEGPYFLVGFSAGATYAFELACTLQKRKERINYLGIIDASAPSPQRKLFNLTRGQGSNSLMAAGHHLYLFLRDRLKTKNGNIFYSAFVKVVSVTSQGLLYLKDASLLSESSPDSDIIFGGEKDEWILATFPPEQQPLGESIKKGNEQVPAKKIFRGYLPFLHRTGC